MNCQGTAQAKFINEEHEAYECEELVRLWGVMETRDDDTTDSRIERLFSLLQCSTLPHYTFGKTASFNQQACATLFPPQVCLQLGQQQQRHTKRTGPKCSRNATCNLQEKEKPLESRNSKHMFASLGITSMKPWNGYEPVPSLRAFAASFCEIARFISSAISPMTYVWLDPSVHAPQKGPVAC